MLYAFDRWVDSLKANSAIQGVWKFPQEECKCREVGWIVGMSEALAWQATVKRHLYIFWEPSLHHVHKVIYVNDQVV